MIHELKIELSKSKYDRKEKTKKPYDKKIQLSIDITIKKELCLIPPPTTLHKQKLDKCYIVTLLFVLDYIILFAI